MADVDITFQCDCSWLDHQLRVTLFDDQTGTACVEMVLPRRSLWERIKKAFRYMATGGDRSIADVVLSKEQVFKLNQFLCDYEYIADAGPGTHPRFPPGEIQ